MNKTIFMDIIFAVQVMKVAESKLAFQIWGHTVFAGYEIALVIPKQLLQSPFSEKKFF